MFVLRTTIVQLKQETVLLQHPLDSSGIYMTLLSHLLRSGDYHLHHLQEVTQLSQSVANKLQTF